MTRVSVARYDAVGRRAVVRTQCTFLASRWSAPEPDAAAARYRTSRTAGPGERLELAALPGASVAVCDVLPDAPGAPVGYAARLPAEAA